MWQPEQPPNQTVANQLFAIAVSLHRFIGEHNRVNTIRPVNVRSNVAPLFLFPLPDPSNKTDILRISATVDPSESTGGAHVHAFSTFGAGNAVSHF
jgi:hypothetical protein